MVSSAHHLRQARQEAREDMAAEIAAEIAEWVKRYNEAVGRGKPFNEPLPLSRPADAM